MIIAGCFLEYNDKFPVLLRHPHKSNGATWGLPAGKVEEGESDEDAVIRELFEETGYKATVDQLEYLGEFYFDPSGRPYVFIAYRIKLEKPFKIVLEAQEHADYRWVSAQECYAEKNLIPDFHQLLTSLGFVG